MASRLARALMEDPHETGVSHASRSSERGPASVERVLLTTFWQSERPKPDGARVIRLTDRRIAKAPARD